MPPTLQKEAKYSYQFLNKDGTAITTFFGKFFAKIGFIYSTKLKFGSIYFLFNV